jgi:hypothetical protein
LLGLSGASVYGLLQWRATRLPAAEQQVLRNEVLVARGSAKPTNANGQIEAETDRRLRAQLEKNPIGRADLEDARKQIRQQVQAEKEVIPPGYSRRWEIDLGLARHRLQGKPLYARVKFNAAEKSASGTFDALWRAGVPRQTQLWHSDLMSLAPDTFHEFQIDPDVFDANGVLTLEFANPNPTTLLFPVDDGIEILYPESGFALNFARGLGIIFCWMALLTALGLASASFLSFPVAAFLSLSVLVMTFSSGTMANAVSEGTIAGYNAEKGIKGYAPVDVIVIPAFRAVLGVINLAKGFSPIDSLSTGRSISWEELGRAFSQIVLLLGGLLGLFGIVVFTRRELATAQGTQ